MFNVLVSVIIGISVKSWFAADSLNFKMLVLSDADTFSFLLANLSERVREFIFSLASGNPDNGLIV